MMENSLMGKTIIVTGATGRQGSAVVRHLLRAGALVKALTRAPHAKKAKRLEALGVDVVAGNMDDPGMLKKIFLGASGVYSVQNPYTASFATEVQQGKNVADAAQAVGVSHLVQGSAGLGHKTGVPSWDSKLEIEAYTQSLGVPMTILRPTAFMELISDPGFYPMASTFHLMPKLTGPDTKIPWLAVEDLGAIAAKVFANPWTYIGQDLKLTSDLQSINDVRALYLDVIGKKPPHFPMPEFMFRLFTGDDLIKMWKYLRTAALDVTPEVTFAILPEAETIRTWLVKQKQKGLLG